MKKTDIVLINMSNYYEWEHGVSNRNYHVFRELEKNQEIGKILLVDYPPLTWKRALRNLKEGVWHKPRQSQKISQGLLQKTCKLSDRLYCFSDVSFWLKPKRFMKNLQKTLTHLGFDDYVIWSFFPPAAPHLAALGSHVTIFDAVDNWAEHSSYLKFKERLLDCYDQIKRSADVIFTVSEDLLNLFDHQPNAHWIPNGVDLKHYQKDWKLVNRDIADLPRPIIGYIGVIQKRVDLPLIRFLAEKNPEKSFVLCGPIWYSEDSQQLTTLPNVHLLGYKEYAQAPMYIQQFDIGLIPHKQDDFISSTNPMKMYEYLACGKPVVATAQSGAEMFRDYIYIATDYEDFNTKLQEALVEAGDEEKAREKKKLMEAYSWSKTVKRMLELVDKKLTY